MSSRPLLASGLVLVSACGAGDLRPVHNTVVVATPTAATTAAPAPKGPTEEDAKKFLVGVDKELRRLWTAQSRADWINKTYITVDSDELAADAQEAQMAYLNQVIPQATKFDGLALPEPLRRQLTLLKLASLPTPSPNDAKKRAKLADLTVWLGSEYGKGKYTPKEDSKLPKLAKAYGVKESAWNLEDLSRLMAKERDAAVLLEAWKGWHATGHHLKARYKEYVELGNEGAKEIGFADMGALWRAGYDMTPEAFEQDTERLYTQIKPLYEQLHCYVRKQLRKKYPAEKIGQKIPAHLLGNMWAQDWNNVYDLVEPYPGAAKLDVTAGLKKKKVDEKGLVRIAEKFFVSVGLDPLPKTFWERSLFKRPEDREVVCHASAWDVNFNNDLRIKMCVEINEEDLLTAHHELGHNYYYHYYYKLPMLFQQGANDGFHEGIGDTIALSVTPKYLHDIDLVPTVQKDDKAALDFLMKTALGKIAFLPFGKLIDQWRWDVFSGKTKPGDWNKAWWQLRERYQGVAAPIARTEADFDAGAKYHVPGGVPYVRYFLAHVYQFQFHRALCKAAGHTGPLHECSIYGNKDAGKKLEAMLRLGASKPWPEAMEALTGEKTADAAALLEYFAPLSKWLADQNKGEQCGF
ncbi:MAG: M2 family metallopeptidase [Myxococcales bacterium]|nr:M2 family metallopeptidase [Myxococcales bacterium]